jgi:hypothetical protein
LCAVVATAQEQHEYVDLGLPSGTLWATCNIGADNPEDYGDYFAWGETATKSYYDWSTLKYCEDDTGDKFSKYNIQSKYGSVDNKTTLDRSDDAACQNWGSDWCMPTQAQFHELKYECTWTWTTKNGKNGYEVKGENGNSIFLPAAGYRSGSSLNIEGYYGYYWSSSLSDYYSFSGHDLDFTPGYVGAYMGMGSTDYRYYGCSVRPVRCR